MADEDLIKDVKTEFPVDNRSLIGSFVLLLLVFISLCVTVYFQDSAESFGLGNVLLALTFGFAAYVNRGDLLRVSIILIGGTLICMFIYIFGGEASQTEPSGASSNNRSHSLPTPEGLAD